MYVTHDPLRIPVWFPNCSVRTYMYLYKKIEYINKKSNGRKFKLQSQMNDNPYLEFNYLTNPVNKTNIAIP